MGRATLVNGFVATGAGVFSNKLVESTGNFAAPFIASGCLLVLGYLVIRGTWLENYGSGGGSATADVFQVKRLGQAWRIVREGNCCSCFSLSEYTRLLNSRAQPFSFRSYVTRSRLDTDLFRRFHVPLRLHLGPLPPRSHSLQHNPPLWLHLLIFHGFHDDRISLLYTMIVSYSKFKSTDSSLTTHAKLSSIVCAVSALALASSITSKSEEVRFWAFCAFEACVGMYYPVQGMLRGTLISNEHRATVSS